MTEADLVHLLARAALRLRLKRALDGACAAALAVLAAYAATVLAARVRPEWSPALAPAAWLAGLLVAAAAVAAFARRRASLAEAAWLLDRRAGLKEALTTWCEYHRAPPADPLRQAFVEVQRRATLSAAVGLRPARHLPLRLPGWSRALWLGVLALGCALLMPPRENTVALGVSRPTAGASQAAGPETFTPGVVPPASAAGQVQMLSPTDLYRLRLYAFNPQVTVEVKKDFLARVEAQLEAIPEAQWPGDVRELLTALRRQTGQERPDEKSAAGSVTVAGTPSVKPPVTSEAGRQPPVAVYSPAEVLGVVRAQYPDVAEALERYYR